MRTLIVLALFGSAFAMPFLQDTPEVVAERQRFLQLFNAQAAAAAAAPDDPTHGGARYQQAPARTQWSAQPAKQQWSTQPAKQQWSAQPTQQWNAPQTPTHQYTPQHHNTIPSVTQKWTGPVAATVPAGVDGNITPVSDTADVAAARAAFLNTYNAALSGGRPAPTAHRSAVPQQTWSAAPQQSWAPAPQQSWAPAPAAQTHTPWTGPAADVGAAHAAFAQAYSAAVSANLG